MTCTQVGAPPGRGQPAAKQYDSKEECDQECESAGTGACRPLNGIGPCVEVKPCMCYGLFSGIGTVCNPLP
jgi:hypothetical protein